MSGNRNNPDNNNNDNQSNRDFTSSMIQEITLEQAYQAADKIKMQGIKIRLTHAIKHKENIRKLNSFHMIRLDLSRALAHVSPEDWSTLHTVIKGLRPNSLNLSNNALALDNYFYEKSQETTNTDEQNPSSKHRRVEFVPLDCISKYDLLTPDIYELNLSDTDLGGVSKESWGKFCEYLRTTNIIKLHVQSNKLGEDRINELNEILRISGQKVLGQMSPDSLQNITARFFARKIIDKTEAYLGLTDTPKSLNYNELQKALLEMNKKLEHPLSPELKEALNKKIDKVQELIHKQMIIGTLLTEPAVETEAKPSPAPKP